MLNVVTGSKYIISHYFRDLCPFNTYIHDPIGLAGNPGADGAAGTRGEKGDVGAAGAQGAIGLVGPQGVDGALGPAGPQGLIGNQGPTGNQGTIIASFCIVFVCSTNE